MLLTKEDCNGLKVVCALMVFFCHVSPIINMLGFIPVGVFFFISGYGCTFSTRKPLYRIVRLGMIYIFVCGIYAMVAGEFILRLQFGWFFLVYGFQMLFITISRKWYNVLMMDMVFSVFLWYIDLSYPWYTSLVMFPMGMLVAARGFIDRRILGVVFLLGLMCFLYCRGFPWCLWLLSVPLSFILIHFRSLYRPVHKMAFLTLPFFLVHTLFLDMLGVRSDMGFPLFMGSMTVSIILSFAGSVAGAYLLYKFVNVANDR